MRDFHADRRDAKRHKKRYGMRVSNKAAHLHEFLVKERAKEAKNARARKYPGPA